MTFNIENPTYIEDLENIAHTVNWEKLKGKSIAITGATGLLGSLIVDFLQYLNSLREANITIYGLARNVEKAQNRFANHVSSKNFKIVQYNLFEPFPDIKAEYVIHCAGNSHPKLFAEDPVGTFMGNILGAESVLKYANRAGASVLLISSGEIYGENQQAATAIQESFSGGIDLSNARSCYSEGKRAVEALCQSYATQYGVKVKIARPCRIFGPTMTEEDNKATAQFLKRAINRTDIILKSDGTQQFSYIYSADAVSALLTILLKGRVSDAYNVANESCNIMLKDLAQLIASELGVKVVYDLAEEPGGSQIKNAILDNTKLKSIGWIGKYDIRQAVRSTIKILERPFRSTT